MSPLLRAAVALTLITTTGAATAQALVQVETAFGRDIVRQVDVTGTVTSPRNAVLSTAVAGLVAELVAEEGDYVNAGDPLLTLDAELATLALERVRATVQQRETELADSRRRLDEVVRVGTERGITATEIASLRAEVSSDTAALAAAQATAREQQAIVDRHTLRAPFAGVISARTTELGEWVNPGDGLMELVAINNLRFDFRVGQELYPELERDAPVDIMLDALPGAAMTGHIDTIVPVKNPGARTFLVRVLADNTGNSPTITPGMSARGRLSVDTGQAGVVVPRDAIIRFPDGRITVWVVETENELPVVRERTVSTGLAFDGVVQVLSGLSQGETIVTRGNETLQEGQTVTVLEH